MDALDTALMDRFAEASGDVDALGEFNRSLVAALSLSIANAAAGDRVSANFLCETVVAELFDRLTFIVEHGRGLE